MNLAAERMFGYSKEELLGENVTRLIPPSYREEYARCFREYSETGDSIVHSGGYEILAQRKDGGHFPVEFSISEVDHSGLFTGIMRDVTRRKELEKEVMEASAAEARRIGHELHEGFQQEMVALELLACTMGEQMNNIAHMYQDDNNVCEVEKSTFDSFRETIAT